VIPVYSLQSTEMKIPSCFSHFPCQVHRITGKDIKFHTENRGNIEINSKIDFAISSAVLIL